jgi:hypothetical protein
MKDFFYMGEAAKAFFPFSLGFMPLKGSEHPEK